MHLDGMKDTKAERETHVIMSALRERGYIHEDISQDDSFNIYDALKKAFASNGTEEFRFYGEDETISLDEWVLEIIQRAHTGLMDSLFIGN